MMHDDPTDALHSMDGFNADSLQRLARYRLGSTTQSTLQELASKANHGNLSAAEREQYAELIEFIDLFAIVKAEAQALLQRRAK